MPHPDQEVLSVTRSPSNRVSRLALSPKRSWNNRTHIQLIDLWRANTRFQLTADDGYLLIGDDGTRTRPSKGFMVP